MEEEDRVKKLYLTEFVSGDEGTYRCEMTHNGKKHEKTFLLKLYGKFFKLILNLYMSENIHLKL